MCLFAVGLNTLAVDELEELLGQLTRSDLSILLNLKQWLYSEKEDSDISKLPVPSFGPLVTKTWWEYLFLGLKILFAGTVLQLIFSYFWQNPDVEVEKSTCVCSLKFTLTFFPSEKYCQGMFLDEC